MVCLGVKPRAAGWKVQTNPLSYGGTPTCSNLCVSTIVNICVFKLAKPTTLVLMYF